MISAAGKWVLLSGQVSVGIAATARNHFSAATYSLFRPVGSGVSGVFAIYPAFDQEYTQMENIIIGGPKVQKGYAEVPPGPGLGIEMNENALEKFLTPGRSRMLVGKKG